MSKLTVTKALDMLAVGGPAASAGIHFAGDKNPDWITRIIPYYYSGLDTFGQNPWRFGGALKGWGGTVNRMAEKKVFKYLGVNGPRTKIENMGDILDYVTYFGKTAYDVWQNRNDNVQAFRQFYLTQYGVDLEDQNDAGYGSYQPMEMITEKWLPYLGQRYLRKVMRKFGMKLPSFKFT